MRLTKNCRKIQGAIARITTECKSNYLCGDVNLYYLGFIYYFPYYIEIDMLEDEIVDIIEELNDMEICAYNYDDKILYSSFGQLNEEEKQIKKQAENDMKRYDKYAPLQGFFQNYNL